VSAAPSDRELLLHLVAQVEALSAKLDRQDRARAGLAKGRARAAAKATRRAEERRKLVLHLAAVDLQRGNPARGRAKRIAAATRGLLSERQVKRHLDTLFGASDSLGSNVAVDENGDSPC
jgi:hypothetical protein